MKGFVPPDPETDVSTLQCAVVKVGRRKRKRVPAGCVHIYPTRIEAQAVAEKLTDSAAAMVLGPSKSSEGQYVYYVMEWLDGD